MLFGADLNETSIEMTQTTAAAPSHTIAAEPARVAVAESAIVTTSAGRRVLAVLRLATGFIFLWAFLDKTFGLGFSTLSKASWLSGGAPSQGFLKSPAVTGPFKGFFAAIASPTTDVLFMLAMLAVGAAVMAGIGLRISAIAGTIVLLFMYLAEWPFTANAASTNPLVDYHVIYALALIVIAVVSAGDTWGLGRAWKRLNVVQHNRWLI